ncbi:MAG: DUF4325 domain-containing protein [gamma proteobacterium symbiont of Stewartia floridana]|nr:MAG: DUF4325 domain-containing protein [gamma proteobacterium symbiont of Stewartia floridana]
MNQDVLNIAEKFSRYPAGRFNSDGPYSGEKFRDDYLVPAIKGKKSLVVDLDGTRGYGSSFLEEAFGGLVRAGYTKEAILSVITLKTDDDSLLLEIMDYIDNAGH